VSYDPDAIDPGPTEDQVLAWNIHNDHAEDGPDDWDEDGHQEYLPGPGGTADAGCLACPGPPQCTGRNGSGCLIPDPGEPAADSGPYPDESPF
jgi:hypothetical protein